MASDPDGWRALFNPQQVHYEDAAGLSRAAAQLRGLPPLVTSWEIERLRRLIADAQEGKRFWLQGGDCAETLADCSSPLLANKLKILLQMSMVLIQGIRVPVIRVGRFAGQYAKPRSQPFEVRDGVKLPSYFGDLVNQPEFTAEARRPDPSRLVTAYYHAGLTLNFIRALSAVGFADVHHPEFWELSFFKQADTVRELKEEYVRTTSLLSEAIGFMEVFGELSLSELTRAEFYSSHEALHLDYESALTRTTPHHPGRYNLSTHFPWIGERTRALDGAHVEFCSQIRNPVGIKLGPKMDPAELTALVQRLNPENEPGRIVLISRMGAKQVEAKLPALLGAVREKGARVLWICDPMHGNTQVTGTGIKTRHFDDILAELAATIEVHRAVGSRLGGVHFEMTGEDVTECIGGAAGISAGDLSRNYASTCDPRLNYRQALEMSFLLSRQLARMYGQPARRGG